MLLEHASTIIMRCKSGLNVISVLYTEMRCYQKILDYNALIDIEFIAEI